MDYISILIVGLVTIASGLLVFIFPKTSNRWVDHLLPFAGSYLFSTVLIHLIPELFEEVHHKEITVGYYILLGFFIQLFLDLFGSELAHGHVKSIPTKASNRSHISLLLALCTHSFIEGLILPKAPKDVWFAILLHKLPASFTLATLLYHSKKRRLTIILSISLFALSAPIGFFTYEYFQAQHLISPQNLVVFNALVIGTLLHISTVMLFEASPNHKISKAKFLFILLGAIAAILFNHYHHHDHHHH